MVNQLIKMANFITTTKYLNTVSLTRLMDRQIYLHYKVLKGIINNRNHLFINKF